MVQIKKLSGNTPSSSKKKFDKNRSFNGVESKNKSPNKRRKSIAAVLPTPIKHKVKKNVSNEWTVLSEDVNIEKVSSKKTGELKANEEATPQATMLPSSVRKSIKSLVSAPIDESTPIRSVKSTPKSIKKKISVSKEADNLNTSLSISSTVKASKNKRKSKLNTEDNKGINTDSIKKKKGLNNRNNSDESKAYQTLESIKNFGNQVKTEDVKNAIEGVIKFRSENPKLKNKLFTDRYPLFLQISCVKLPTGYSKILRIPLPHSVLTPDDEICLIVPEVKGVKNIEHEKHVEHYEELLRNKGVTNIKKIMTSHELRTEYETFEQKSRLVDLYDIFLVDGKICGKTVKKCGKIFYKKRKVPVPIKLQATKLKENIEKALSKVFFFLHLKGDTFTVQFGHDQMETEKLVENVYSIVGFLDKNFPGGFENIKGIQVYAQRTTSIPIYMNFKSPNLVTAPDVKPRLPKAYKVYKDELSTFNDAEVIVKPTGEVLVERKQNEINESGDNIITDSDIIQANVDEKNGDEDGKKKKRSRKRKQMLSINTGNDVTENDVTENPKKPKLSDQEKVSVPSKEKVPNKKKLLKSKVKSGNSETEVRAAKVDEEQENEQIIDTKVKISKTKKVNKEKKSKNVAKVEVTSQKKKKKTLA